MEPLLVDIHTLGSSVHHNVKPVSSFGYLHLAKKKNTDKETQMTSQSLHYSSGASRWQYRHHNEILLQQYVEEEN